MPERPESLSERRRHKLALKVGPDPLAICRLDVNAPLPSRLQFGSFWSITRTRDELTVVCPEWLIPEQSEADVGWVVLSVVGPLDLEMTGVMAELATTLAEADVSLFAISTFGTDHILVRDEFLEQAVVALRSAGYVLEEFRGPGS